MSIDLVKAMIQRRIQAARDSAKRLSVDPTLRASEFQQRAVCNAMQSLLQDINLGREGGR